MTPLRSIIRGHQLIPGKWTAAVNPPPPSSSPLPPAQIPRARTHTRTHTHAHTHARTHSSANSAESTRAHLNSSFFFFLSSILFHPSLPAALLHLLHRSFPPHASLHHLARPDLPAPNHSHYFEMCRHLQLSYLWQSRSILNEHIFFRVCSCCD